MDYLEDYCPDEMSWSVDPDLWNKVWLLSQFYRTIITTSFLSIHT